MIGGNCKCCVRGIPEGRGQVWSCLLRSARFRCEVLPANWRGVGTKCQDVKRPPRVFDSTIAAEMAVDMPCEGDLSNGGVGRKERPLGEWRRMRVGTERGKAL